MSFLARSWRRVRVRTYYTRSKDKKRTGGQAWLLLGGVTASITGGAVYFLGKPDDVIEGLGVQEPPKYANEMFLVAYLKRARDRIVETKKTFSEPSSEKLLPDLLPPPYQRPYTLVLELNDLLIHTDYDRSVGWRYQKRPGVDALLVALFDYYEIVVFTSEAAMTGNSIANALDPNQLIMYRLFRDSTKYVDGQHVKDLSVLNRSLNRVIVVDTNKDSVKYHPENTLVLDKWTGDITDRTLWDLIRFLQTIAVLKVDDTRPVLDYYKREGGEENVLDTFKSYQARLLAEEEESRRLMESQKSRTGRGQISPFSFQRKKAQHNVPSLPQLDEVHPTSPETPTRTLDPQQEQSKQSWTQWLGSWVGWK